MARQKKKPEDNESMTPSAAPKQSRTGKPVNFWAEEELVAALRAYIDSVRPRPSLTSVAKLALEEYLERHGFWPPKPVE